ncbi:MAG: hypothetical protein LBR11_06775 [Deltaproteobacteria bacterium]|jgi:hypothetical protein|nr:hypothetical protein [Deltaproteobacteria bacterium]
MSFLNNPDQALAEAQKAQNVIAECNYLLAQGLKTMAATLDLQPWFWEPAVNEVPQDDLFPLTIRPVGFLTGTGYLPLSDSRHIFATRNPLAVSPRVGDAILVAHAVFNLALEDLDMEELEDLEAVFRLKPGPALLRVHLYKVSQAAPDYATLEDLWNDTADYGEEPGWDQSGTEAMRVWRGDFDLAEFLCDPKVLAEAVKGRLAEEIPASVL